MEDRAETSTFAVVESLTGWWALAGLDSAVSDSAVNWLADDALEKSPTAPLVDTPAKKPAEPVKAPAIAWPIDIAELREMVASGAPLPGTT